MADPGLDSHNPRGAGVRQPRPAFEKVPSRMTAGLPQIQNLSRYAPRNIQNSSVERVAAIPGAAKAVPAVPRNPAHTAKASDSNTAAVQKAIPDKDPASDLLRRHCPRLLCACGWFIAARAYLPILITESSVRRDLHRHD
jgi:hypothetical protein